MYQYSLYEVFLVEVYSLGIFGFIIRGTLMEHITREASSVLFIDGRTRLDRMRSKKGPQMLKSTIVAVFLNLSGSEFQLKLICYVTVPVKIN